MVSSRCQTYPTYKYNHGRHWTASSTMLTSLLSVSLSSWSVPIDTTPTDQTFCNALRPLYALDLFYPRLVSRHTHTHTHAWKHTVYSHHTRVEKQQKRKLTKTELFPQNWKKLSPAIVRDPIWFSLSTIQHLIEIFALCNCPSAFDTLSKEHCSGSFQSSPQTQNICHSKAQSCGCLESVWLAELASFRYNQRV